MSVMKRLAGAAALVGVAGLGAAACAAPSGPPSASGSTPPVQSSDTGTSAPPTSTSSPHRAPTASPSSAISPTGTPACQKAEMGVGTWKGVPGSSGAGHEVADLAFQNTSDHACTVSGFPRLTLHTASGAVLPTTVTNFEPAMVTPLTVAPGGWIHSELRYVPHIPGPTEPQTGPCEPAAGYLLVRLPGDTAFEHVTIAPPTTFCIQGSIDAKPFLDGPASPNGG